MGVSPQGLAPWVWARLHTSAVTSSAARRRWASRRGRQRSVKRPLQPPPPSGVSSPDDSSLKSKRRSCMRRGLLGIGIILLVAVNGFAQTADEIIASYIATVAGNDPIPPV